MKLIHISYTCRRVSRGPVPPPSHLENRASQINIGYKLQYGMAWHGTARYGTVLHGTSQHGTARHGTAQHDTAQHGTTWHGTAQYSIV